MFLNSKKVKIYRLDSNPSKCSKTVQKCIEYSKTEKFLTFFCDCEFFLRSTSKVQKSLEIHIARNLVYVT